MATLPSSSFTVNGYQRPFSIGGPLDQVFVAGLKMLMCSSPARVLHGVSLCPPATNRRPSGRKLCPLQKRLVVALSTAWNVLVAGFQMLALLCPTTSSVVKV